MATDPEEEKKVHLSRRIHNFLWEEIGPWYLGAIKSFPKAGNFSNTFASSFNYGGIAVTVFRPASPRKKYAALVALGTPGDNLPGEMHWDINDCTEEELQVECYLMAKTLVRMLFNFDPDSVILTDEARYMTTLLREDPTKVMDWMVSTDALERTVAKNYLERGQHA
jgi:hypothetical protein